VRDLDAIKSWIATEMVPPIVKFENKKQLERLFMGPIAANIFVFLPEDATEAEKMSKSLESAARQLRGKVHIITVDAKETVMHDYFSLRESDGPTIRLLSHDLKYQYKGSLEAAEISNDVVHFFKEFEAKKLVPLLKSQDPLPKDGDVLQVVGKTFQSLLMDNDKHVFVWFYAPWCRTCKAMKPVWDKLATLYKDEKDIIIAKMDATKNEAKDLHVRHYPTVYYYHSGDKPRHEEYDGHMETDAFTDFLTERTGKSPHKRRRRTPHMEL
jgi:protein disulfide isomerase